MNRRLFLRGVGGASLAAPLLWSWGHTRASKAQTPETIKRSVIFFTHYGAIVPRWYDQLRDHEGVIEASMLGDTLRPLSPHAEKLLFPQGLAMFPRGAYVGHTDPHDQASASILTCAPMTSDTMLFPSGHSIDWEISRNINPVGVTRSPLVLRMGQSLVGASSLDPALVIREFISYEGPQTPYTPETNPLNVYSALTGLFGGGETEADYLVAQGQSIIDIVGDDLDAMRRVPMSAADVRKVDDWLELVRETELSVVPLACTGSIAEALGISQASASADFTSSPEKKWSAAGDMMIKLVALSMICDTNRSIVLNWDGKAVFQWDGIDVSTDHHSLSHLEDGEGGAPETVRGLVQEIDAWYAQRYADLVTLIDSVEEGEGTLLDNSAVMWIPEMSDGNEHSGYDLPVCVAGSLGGYLKQGYSTKLPSLGDDTAPDRGHPLNRLYTTVLNGLGVTDAAGDPVQSFGVLDNNGDFDPEDPGRTGIRYPGEIDEIKAG